MVDHDDKYAAMYAVFKTLAADTASAVGPVSSYETAIVTWSERDGRRRYPIQSRPLIVVTTGIGVVASAHPDHVDWLKEHMDWSEREEIFSASRIAKLSNYLEDHDQMLLGPNLVFVCSRSHLQSVKTAHPVTKISTYEGDEVRGLYRYPNFTHALGYGADPERPDVLATVAIEQGEVIGIAGASADCDALWQIGVDVVEHARGSGIGRALVSRLAEAILDCGRVPYYATSVSNIDSCSLAISLGFWPAWTEMYARDHQ